MPGNSVDRFLVGVVIAASLVTVLTAGRTIRRWRTAASPAPVTSAPTDPAPALSPPHVEATASFGSDTARRLLESVPEGCELDDLRIFWPGPQFSLRGHAGPGAETLRRLSYWETQFEGLVAASGRPYQVWFRRLEGLEDEPEITFEFLLVPDGSAVSL